jgi:predicted MPP superfamily phosphohydrolase
MLRRSLIIIVFTLGSWTAGAQLAMPTRPDSLKFAVIGDNGDGSTGEYDIGRQMATERTAFPFEFVVMLGDNMYGSQKPKDFITKFEQPFAALLQAGIPFHAAIGNHDSEATITYDKFNMAGRRYYTYTRKDAQFFVFDTNLLDKVQLAWIDDTLSRSVTPWKIAYFHHPLYSNGDRHGSNVEIRVALEPLLIKYGVTVVFAAHDHVYERLTPQKGITHFVEGSGGRLRKGGLTPSATTAAYYDQDQTFMLVEVSRDELFFRTISRTGRTVDSGVIRRRPTT